MPEIGILCRPQEQAGKVRQTLQLILAQNGLTYAVRELSLSFWEDGEIGEEKDGREDPKRLSCLILAWDDREKAFELAERLWERQPSLQIIYIAQGSEDIFAALQMPFFHLVRVFDMEQGLRAAMRKLERLKNLLPEKISFTSSGGKLLVQRRDIVYLESQRHVVLLHTRKDVSGITENLSQCEEKLKGMGFVRIHRSFLVNMYHIVSLEKESVLLLSGERLYISRYRYAEVKLEFESYIRRLEFI